MRPRKKEREGDFIEAQIAPSAFAYCRFLPPDAFVFYDFTAAEPIKSVSALANKAFIVAIGVMLYATRDGHWKIVENAPIPEELCALLNKPGFFRDEVNSPMTAEHFLRELFQVKGYEELDPNSPWQTAAL